MDRTEGKTLQEAPLKMKDSRNRADTVHGTVTGRISSHELPFHELPRGNTPKRGVWSPPPLPAALRDLDYRRAEERVACLMATFDEATAFTSEQWASIEAKGRKL